AGVRIAFRARDGVPLRGGGCGRRARHQRAGGVGSLAASRSASEAGRGVPRFHEADPGVSRPRSIAVCADATIRALNVGGDARSLPDPDARTRGPALSIALERESAGDYGGREAVSLGGGLSRSL